jgi:hypothetical protein
VIDFVLMGLLIAGLYFNRNILPAVVAYGFCVAYQNTYFDDHSAVVNHLIYGLIFLPCLLFATMRLSWAMLLYAAFHLVVAIDYFLFPDSETLISLFYHIIQVLLVFSLIYFGTRRADNEDRSDNSFAGRHCAGLVDTWHIQTFTKPQKRG